MDRDLQNVIREAILTSTGSRVSNIEFIPVSGGSINHCFKVQADGDANFFLKQNSAKNFPHLFEREKEGLDHLAALNSIRIPRVIDLLKYRDQQLLLMEFIREGDRTSLFWQKFGEQLANLHHHSQPRFGFKNDNYMGSLPQANSEEEVWVRFFLQHRLEPQLMLAKDRVLVDESLTKSFHILFNRLEKFFEPEPPSALHGDLWSGNFLCDENQDPVLIDPAVYFGHRSVDLGMTTLFGGFDKAFYSSYNYHYPLPANYQEQWEICNLYPLLIHLNLFGRTYLNGIRNILRKYS